LRKNWENFPNKFHSEQQKQGENPVFVLLWGYLKYSKNEKKAVNAGNSRKFQFKREHWILSICLFLGFIFTFENISLLDFWLDEAGVSIALRKPFGELGRATIAYSQQLLHNYALKIWSLAFGNNLMALRGFSVFCFLLLIWMMYKAGTYFFGKKEVGLLAAFLTATNYFAIWYAIEVKAYTLAALVGLLSFYFFVKSVREPGWKSYLPYFVFTALGFYVHPWIALIFGSQIISVLVFRKYLKKVFRMLLVQFLIFLTSIPFILISLNQGRLGVNTYIEKVYWWRIFESFSYLSFGSSWAYLVITLVVLIYLAAKSKYFRGDESAKISNELEKEDWKMNMVVIFYLLVPMVGALVISQFKPAYVVGRYEMTVLPAFLLILANLWLKIKDKAWIALVAVLLLFFAFKNVMAFRSNNEAYRSTDKTVIEEIYSEAQSGDYMVTTELSWATAYYFSDEMASEKKINILSYPKNVPDQVVWLNWNGVNDPNNLEKYTQEADAIVEKMKKDPTAGQIFVLYKADSKINQTLKDKLDQNFDFVREYDPQQPREASWFDYVLIYRKR
jgi:hypothetical protein